MNTMNSTVKPKYKVGDIVSWVCNSCGDVHKGKIDFAVSGFAYDPPHYEVLTVCCGEEKRVYVSEWDVLPENEKL